MTATLSTIDDLIEALGGDTSVADWLGISQPAVANWKARKEIPPGWHLRILARLKAERMTADPSIFGLTEQEARELFGPRPLVRRRARADAAFAA
jgi:hypothetical protein